LRAPPFQGLDDSSAIFAAAGSWKKKHEKDERFRHGFWRRDQAQSFELLHSDGVARDGFLNPHLWEIGMVFDLEILAAGETRW
jgi:hypothetical protein